MFRELHILRFLDCSLNKTRRLQDNWTTFVEFCARRRREKKRTHGGVYRWRAAMLCLVFLICPCYFCFPSCTLDFTHTHTRTLFSSRHYLPRPTTCRRVVNYLWSSFRWGGQFLFLLPLYSWLSGRTLFFLLEPSQIVHGGLLVCTSCLCRYVGRI